MSIRLVPIAQEILMISSSMRAEVMVMFGLFGEDHFYKFKKYGKILSDLT